MFGYVKPYVPDLRVRENEMYRALYCGLCRSMGKCTGCASKFTLSYDFVFLAAVRCILEDCEVKAKARRCIAHPLRKRPMICDNGAMRYSAACAAVLTKAKVLDDVNDAKGIRSVLPRLLIPAATHMEKRAMAKTSVPADKIYASLEKLSALEKGGCPSLDETSDRFADLLSAVFSHGLDGPKARIAAEIGSAVGKYIYVIDAADDAAHDEKTGSYNPLNISNISAEAVGVAIRLELEKAAQAVELMEPGRYPELYEIIRNIIYEGLPKEADRILGRKVGKNR